MSAIDILNSLTIDQLNTLYRLSKPTHTVKFGLKSAILALYLPYFVVGLLVGFNLVYIYISLTVLLIIAIARKKSKEKKFDNIFMFVYGLSFYVLLISSNIISVNFSTLVIVISLYIIGIKLIKLSLFKSFVEQKVINKKTGLTNKGNIAAISISIIVTALLGDSIINLLLIFFSYFLSIIAASFTFNPYYYSEQVCRIKLIEENN